MAPCCQGDGLSRKHPCGSFLPSLPAANTCENKRGLSYSARSCDFMSGLEIMWVYRNALLPLPLVYNLPQRIHY